MIREIYFIQAIHLIYLTNFIYSVQLIYLTTLKGIKNICIILSKLS